LKDYIAVNEGVVGAIPTRLTLQAGSSAGEH
jgi:hypothetical protein